MYNCRICGKEFEQIKGYRLRRHLKKEHSLTKYEYAHKYEPKWVEEGLTKGKLKGELTKKEEIERKIQSGEIDTVRCEICGKEFQTLKNHIPKHNITSKEYKKMFPDARIMSESLSKRQSEVGKQNKERFVSMVKMNWKDSEYSEKMKKLAGETITKRNLENWKDEEYRKKMSENQKKVVTRQLQDPEFRKMLSDNGRKSWEGKTYEETKSRREQARRLAKEVSYKATWGNPEWVKKHKENFNKMLREGKMAYKPAVIEIELEGKKYIFKSSYELAFALYLLENKIEFLYEPMSIDYFYNGKERFYTVDFYLPSKETYYEIKGYVRNPEQLQEQIKALKEKTRKEVILADDKFLKEMFDFKRYLNRARLIYKNTKGE